MYEELELRRQVCFALYSASRATTAVYRPLLHELGLTYPQYVVLLTLWERDGRSVTEIGETLALDSGTLSPLLRRLEGLGLVERRRRATSDERRVEIHLTSAGWALRERARGLPSHLASCAELPTGELTALLDTLTQLTATLRTTACHDPSATLSDPSDALPGPKNLPDPTKETL